MKKASAVTGYWKVKPDNNKKIGTTVSVKVVNTKGKTVTETKKHVHDYKAVYKTVHHDEAGHYETVEVPAWDETVQRRHQVCFVEEIKRRILLIVLIIKLIHNYQMNILQLMI